MPRMDHIAGQDKAIDLLLKQVADDRLHHAMIFHGPWGVGKFTTAIMFARLLLCENPVTDLAGNLTACGTCRHCRMTPTPDTKHHAEVSDDPMSMNLDAEMLALSAPHPDLHVITKELARFSDDSQIRNRKLTRIPVQIILDKLVDPVQKAPQIARRKVFIVDEAELLNEAGQNRLLKTLEEPPGDTVIILVTSSEDRLLPTIRSRCMRVGFMPLSDTVVSNWMDQQPSPSGQSLDDAMKQWMLHFAEGSLGRAKLAMMYDLGQWAAAVLPAVDGLAKARMDGELGSRMATLVNDFASTWVDRHDKQAKAFADLIDSDDTTGKLTSKEAANKVAGDMMWSMLASHARQRARQCAEQLTAGTDAIEAESKLEPWLGVIDATEKARELVNSNVNLSLVCDHLVLQMTRCLARLR